MLFQGLTSEVNKKKTIFLGNCHSILQTYRTEVQNDYEHVRSSMVLMCQTVPSRLKNWSILDLISNDWNLEQADATEHLVRGSTGKPGRQLQVAEAVLLTRRMASVLRN